MPVSKLAINPAISHLTGQKGDVDEWTVNLLRNNLHKYITNRENADRKRSSKFRMTVHILLNTAWLISQIRSVKP